MNHQEKVNDWVNTTFGPEIQVNKQERAWRFLEEALELAQASGVTIGEADAIYDYVFNRPVGEVAQEISGGMITLMALGTAYKIDVMNELDRELKRVSDPFVMAKIRAKALAAPERPLPQ